MGHKFNNFLTTSARMLDENQAGFCCRQTEYMCRAGCKTLSSAGDYVQDLQQPATLNSVNLYTFYITIPAYSGSYSSSWALFPRLPPSFRFAIQSPKNKQTNKQTKYGRDLGTRLVLILYTIAYSRAGLTACGPKTVEENMLPCAQPFHCLFTHCIKV